MTPYDPTLLEHGIARHSIDWSAALALRIYMVFQKDFLQQIALSFMSARVLFGCVRDKTAKQECLVFAAASLTDVFTSIAEEFEKANPAIDVKISFAGSQSLRTQIENGANPDVFASANESHIDALVQSDLVVKPTYFAENQMVIVVPKENPSGITSMRELIQAERLVLAGESVPAGQYSNQILNKAALSYGQSYLRAVKENVVSRETHVRQTLQKVILGEADAAMVYATDAASTMENITVIPIPSEFNVKARYPVAKLKASKTHNGTLFIEYLRSKMGREKLQLHGFVVP